MVVVGGRATAHDKKSCGESGGNIKDEEEEEKTNNYDYNYYWQQRVHTKHNHKVEKSLTN